MSTHTFTHTVSEGRCMSACQKHSGIERSAGAVGNTRKRVPALHPLLSLIFPPATPSPPFCYLSGPPCLSFPSLSLALLPPSPFEYLFFSLLHSHLSLPPSPPLPSPWFFLDSFLFSLSFSLLKSTETYMQTLV